MTESGALPLRHLSIRVPWHDAEWNGAVCSRPAENVDCLRLTRIREHRNEAAEESLAGGCCLNLNEGQWPPCIMERGNFMSPFELRRMVTHPYFGKSEAHKHFAPTELRYPPYSAACIPFRWMLRDNGPSLAHEFDIPYQPELEERARKLMGFGETWIQGQARPGRDARYLLRLHQAPAIALLRVCQAAVVCDRSLWSRTIANCSWIVGLR